MQHVRSGQRSTRGTAARADGVYAHDPEELRQVLDLAHGELASAVLRRARARREGRPRVVARLERLDG